MSLQRACRTDPHWPTSQMRRVHLKCSTGLRVAMLIGLKKPSRRIEKAKAETSSGKDGARARSRPDWARLSQHASHRRPPGETLAPRRSRQRHGAMDRRATHRFHQGVSRHRRFSNAKCRDSVLTKYPDAVCSVRQSAMMTIALSN